MKEIEERKEIEEEKENERLWVRVRVGKGLVTEERPAEK